MSQAAPLSSTGRYVILAVAFLGWLCCGFHMQITQLAGRPAAIDLLAANGSIQGTRFDELNAIAKRTRLSEADAELLQAWEADVGRWAAWFQCAFLFGAATGGLLFGRLGDWIGRSRAMAASIVVYSALAAAASLAQSPEQFWILWFLACTGVGGMWPNGVALVSEAWSSMSRPAVAGTIGTAANIGILLFATLAASVAIKPDDWRWAPLAGSAPLVLGVIAFLIVPESPKWLASRASRQQTGNAPSVAVSQSLIGITVVAIVLATVPIIGGWGVSNWMNPWADQAGMALDPPDPFLKARLGQARAFTGIVGSLLGGWIATLVGRRLTYFLASVLSLGIAQYMFIALTPTDEWFLTWVAILGFVSGIYFGWLPLCLPELFPTHYRATGAGIGFNFGRIVTAVTIFISGALMTYFEGSYPRIGRITSLLFVLGIVFIWFVPDTSKRQLED